MSKYLISCAWIAIALNGSACDLFDPDTDTDTETVTFTGTVAIPDAPTDKIILGTDVWLGYQWSSCPETGNDSSLRGDGSFLLESTNNCAGAQYVYFYSDTALDLSDFAEGYIRFKLQVNNAGQGLQLLIQDSNATASHSVDLGLYGYNSTEIAVDQLIAVPVTALVNDSFNLASVSRAFQLSVSCPSSDCLTTVSDIRWTNSYSATTTPAPTWTVYSTLRGAAPFAPLATNSQRRWPRCEPRACQPVSQARIGIVSPSRSGWTAEPVQTTTTDSDGEFSLVVSLELLQQGGPFYLAATSFDGAFTLLSPIPGDLIEGGSSVELGIDRTTTAASVMTCPNGLTIPTDGSGGWCIGDPLTTTELDPLYDSIDLSLTTSVSVEIAIIIDDATDDAAVVAILNELLNNHGLANVTEADLAEAAQTVILPDVDFPVYEDPDGTDGTPDGTPDDSTYGQCSEYITCEVCSISACVNATSTSCSAGYKASDGATFACTSCEDCYSAAEAATAYCCPVPQ